MQISLANKTALVTGGSKGLGKAIAQQLVTTGADTAICARTPDALQRAAKELGARGYVCDVSRAEEISALAEHAGPVDILVINAGGPPPGSLHDISDEMWQQSVELTFMSVVRLVRLYLPTMQERGWGRIICLTSSSVKQPLNTLLTSNALRSAVTGFVKTISNEVAASGVTVNCVAPGMFDTQRLRQLMEHNKTTASDVVHTIPLGRLGRVEELAAAVAFLASEQASYITGIELPVDGGFTKGI